MKEIYTGSVQLLATVSEINWKDFDYGQLEKKPGSVKYPCALFKFSSTNKDIDESGSQIRSWSVQLRIAFDVTGARTSSEAPESVIERSLAWASVISDVYAAFQAVSPAELFDAYECKSEGLETRDDGLVVYKYQFVTNEQKFV